MSGDNVVLARNVEGAPVSPLHAQTAAFSHYNNLSAQLPLDPETGELVEGGALEQAAQCFENLEAVAEGIGHTLGDVARLTVFVRDIRDLDAVDEAFRAYFPTYVPARTSLAVAALPLDALVQVEALLTNGEGTIPDAPQAGDLVKYVSNTHNAPYDALSSQTVAFSHYNNISAQLGVDAATGELVAGGVAEQAEQACKNIQAIIENVEHTMADAVKVNVYLRDLADLAAVEDVCARCFPGTPAFRAVGTSALPMDALVMIDAIFGNAEGTPPVA